MNIICCYAENDLRVNSRLKPQTRTSVETYAEHAEFVNVGETENDYWSAVSSRWTGEDDLVIIEHDTEITSNTIAEFEACGNDWCAAVYPTSGYPEFEYGLGCTRFSASLQRTVVFPAMVSWWYLDTAIKSTLLKSGREPCKHSKVRHHHTFANPEVARDWDSYSGLSSVE